MTGPARYRARVLGTVALAMISSVACHSSGPQATLAPIPDVGASPSEPKGLVASALISPSPVAVVKTCSDFTTREAAQSFFLESGGPRQDLHGLDPDHNGQACDELPSAAASNDAPAPAPATPIVRHEPTPIPNGTNSTKGTVVTGKPVGGSTHDHRCSSSDGQCSTPKPKS